MSTKLFIVAAPSGAGKTTLCERLLANFPEKLRRSISCTTRPPRGAEQHGREYYFLALPDFEDRIQRGDFAEWAKVHNNYYGTLKHTITQAFDDGFSVVLDIDVQGAESLRTLYQDQCVRIFISPPSFQELETRLRGRNTEAEEVIQRRLKNARKEMNAAKDFDHIIINDRLERAYAELESIVRAHL